MNPLFKGFARVWTPFWPSDELKDKPLSLMLAGEKLVLFRGKEGVGALIDRCPHRGVALSNGMVRDGCIECPMHGWRFNPAGELTKVPFNPDAKCGTIRATSLPTLEGGGLIWVYTEPNATNPPPPVLYHALKSYKPGRIRNNAFATHWTRVLENSLDAAHLPFVHRWTIGSMLRKPAVRGADMEVTFTETNDGMDIRWAVGGATSGSNVGELGFVKPNVMTLGMNKAHDYAKLPLSVSIPVDEHTTRLMTISPAASPFFLLLEALIGKRLMKEDRRAVESSQPAEIPTAGVEVSMPTDRATLAFRKYYDKNLRNSSIG